MLILLKKIHERFLTEAENLCNKFLKAIKDAEDFQYLDDQELEILASLKHFEGRMQ